MLDISYNIENAKGITLLISKYIHNIHNNLIWQISVQLMLSKVYSYETFCSRVSPSNAVPYLVATDHYNHHHNSQTMSIDVPSPQSK